MGLGGGREVRGGAGVGTGRPAQARSRRRRLVGDVGGGRGGTSRRAEHLLIQARSWATSTFIIPLL